MKHLLHSFLTVIFSIAIAHGQICEPDQMYADSSFGVYPPPYDTLTMTGGIDEIACINTPYFTALTVVIPDEIMLPSPPITVALDSIVVTGVSGAPTGMGHGCNPPNCVFKPSDVMGCAALYGTADETNATGDYILNLEGLVYTPLTPNGIDLPTVLDFLSPNDFFITLKDEGSSDCFVNTEEPLNDKIRIETAPNPFGYFTTISIHADITENLDFRVYNLLGEQVHYQEVVIMSGTNTVEFDGSHLAAGVYHFTFTDGQSVLTQKMLIQR